MKEVERILKLDQAGEYGAIYIYSAQLLIARVLYKNIVSKLKEMISHEKDHYKTFNNLLITRSMRPFRIIKFLGSRRVCFRTFHSYYWPQGNLDLY